MYAAGWGFKCRSSVTGLEGHLTPSHNRKTSAEKKGSCRTLQENKISTVNKEANIFRLALSLKAYYQTEVNEVNFTAYVWG